MGAVNGDERLPDRQMGLSTAGWYSTGADGSGGITAAMTAGGQAGNPVGSTLFASSQLPGTPRVPVMAGDTCSSSADAPVPVSGDPMSGLPLDMLTSTGAGRGSVAGPRHPAAGS